MDYQEFLKQKIKSGKYYRSSNQGGLIMTDYDKLKKCFDEIGIEYNSVEKNDEINNYFITLPAPFGNVYVEFSFDENGKYQDVDGNY